MEGRQHHRMDVRGLAGFAVFAGLKTQSEMMTLTQRLSSGLRVNNAADDPSGLAIATSLATRVQGLDEGARQLQTATNALTVADGAMAQISDILQRMRALVVQARSDLQSAADRGNIQLELNQLMLEINKIAQNTNFNGRALLDGSASSALAQPQRALIVVNSPTSNGTTLIDTVVDPNQPNVIAGAPQLVQTISIDSYNSTADVLNMTVVIGSQEARFGPDQTATVQIQNGTNVPPFGTPPSTPGFSPTFQQYDQYGNPVLGFNIGVLTPADVGKTAVIVTLPAQQKQPGSALAVNTGGAEGSVVSVDIPGMSAVNLGVNEVILGNDLQNQGAEYRVDYAIETLAATRAQVGAQSVSLQEEATNNQVTSVNTQASESAIRDVNVGAASTQFVRDQVLTQFQTKLVADAERLSQTFATLVADALVR